MLPTEPLRRNGIQAALADIAGGEHDDEQSRGTAWQWREGIGLVIGGNGSLDFFSARRHG
jgi:hypothetical protein